ncbi:DEAD/DEAH box helicase [uncultured Clostridium sp.]|uniref:DEAD/DEAH box helicase n=1 Tax=uncultured Clostridium sp. TaxID=59620 RepID=UPI0025FC7939|nr:DEAD/DEAH box helicase [uncultured Clostridium sp.]MDU4883853.1 DEAD/DEAH box helicase [Clostridium celatum]MDU7077096.1 DEAD/DEAH box helicase [Clostridium celatum]
MDLKILLDNVLALGSNISIKDGKEIYKNRLVSNLSSKKINDIYHIYSKVTEEDNSKEYSCHIKYNLKSERVIGATCTCSTYEEFSKHKTNYICKHIIAAIFYFYIVAKNKIKKINKENSNLNKKKESKVNVEKKILNLDLDIKRNENRTFDIQIRIGENNTYLITKISEFLKCKEVKGQLRINGEFLYNSSYMKFKEEDEKLLDYIVLNLNRENAFKIVEGKILRINEEYIEEILKLVSDNRKVKLNYDYINYESYIIKDNMPLSFTVKMDFDKIILTTKKKLPIPLNNEFTVFLNDRKIYLSSEKQINNYKVLYNKLKNHGKIEYPKQESSINELFNLLGDISKDIILGEGVKNLCRNYYKVKIFFKNENNDIKCKATVNYFGKIINILDKNIDYFLRDNNFEEEISMKLERYRFIKKTNEFLFVGSDEERYELLTNGLNLFEGFSKLEFSKSFNEANLLGSNDIHAIFERQEEELRFKYDIDGLDYSEYINVLQALEEDRDFYKTKTGRLLNLRDLGISNFFNIIDNLIYNQEIYDGEIEIDKSKAIFIENNIENYNLNFIRGAEILKIISKRLESRFIEEVNGVKELNGILRNYQVTGLNYLLSLSEMNFGGILADEMGLGKTIQVIAFLLYKKNNMSLIVTPTSLIYNWKEEFEKFAPTLKVGVIHGSKSARNKILDNKEEYDILLTTYGTIKNDIEFYKNEIFDYCIIDEAQNIKNPKAQNTKIIKEINAKVKFALTGTPIENSLIELWSIFDFIMPGYLFDEKKFKKKFVNRSEKEIEELKSLIKPFILRRLKKDVITELPEKIEKKYYVPMTSEQKLAYKNYMKEVKLKLKTGENDNITIFSYLTRLRQICQDPILVNKDYTDDSGKLNVALEIIEDVIEDNNKMLVFSQFTSVLKKIEDELNIREIKNKYLDGSTSAKERIKLVSEFNESKEPEIFLISLKAGGTGLNLTSAKFVMHMDPWWNPAIEDQATDRAHRIGQKNIVEVIKLVAKDTIEEKIIQLQEDKREIINSVMSDNSLNINNISKLTNEEILDLFK